MEELQEYRQHLLDRYASFADELAATLQLIPESALQSPVDEGEWNIHRIASHLRDMETLVIVPRLRCILSEESPTLEDYDHSNWLQARYRDGEPLQAILRDYLELQRQELEALRNSPPGAWNRTARYSRWGVRTLQWMVEHNLVYAIKHLLYIKGHKVNLDEV